MPVPYRKLPRAAQEGVAAFVDVVRARTARQIVGALLLIDGRGQPLEFVHNVVDVPGGFLWPEDKVRAVGTTVLVHSLFDACQREPDLLVCRDTLGTPDFCRDELAPAIPFAQIARRRRDYACRLGLDQRPARAGNAGASAVRASGAARLHRGAVRPPAGRPAHRLPARVSGAEAKRKTLPIPAVRRFALRREHGRKNDPGAARAKRCRSSAYRVWRPPGRRTRPRLSPLKWANGSYTGRVRSRSPCRCPGCPRLATRRGWKWERPAPILSAGSISTISGMPFPPSARPKTTIAPASPSRALSPEDDFLRRLAARLQPPLSSPDRAERRPGMARAPPALSAGRHCRPALPPRTAARRRHGTWENRSSDCGPADPVFSAADTERAGGLPGFPAGAVAAGTGAVGARFAGRHDCRDAPGTEQLCGASGRMSDWSVTRPCAWTWWRSPTALPAAKRGTWWCWMRRRASRTANRATPSPASGCGARGAGR